MRRATSSLVFVPIGRDEGRGSYEFVRDEPGRTRDEGRTKAKGQGEWEAR